MRSGYNMNRYMGLI